MIMEQYGKVDACHMGDRENPGNAPTWIKYQTRDAAEKAMAALEGGTCLSQGEVLRGEWRTNPEQPKSQGLRDIGPETYTSRDLAERDRNRGGDRGGGRDRRRSRSRGRGGSRDRRRRSASRGGDKNRRIDDPPYTSKYPTCPLGHDIEKIKEREQACGCCHTGITDDNPILRCHECRYLICEKCAKNRVLS